MKLNKNIRRLLFAFQKTRTNLYIAHRSCLKREHLNFIEQRE